MTTFGICMVRNEIDVIGGTLAHMAGEVDSLIVLDNGSIDGTRELLADLSTTLPLWVLDDPDPAYYQSARMTHLADLAGEAGADWIVPFDADEIWSAPERLNVHLAGVPNFYTVVRADLWNHWATAVDPDEVDVFKRLVWKDSKPNPLPKVAFRWQPDVVVHQGNHGVTYLNKGQPNKTLGRAIDVRHFPYRSAEQFIRKARQGAAAIGATDLPDTDCAHWRSYGALLERGGEELLTQVYREHFWHLSPTDSGMVLDPAPYRRWEQVDVG